MRKLFGLNKGIAEAVKIAGGQSLLGEALGRQQPIISKYLHGKKAVPIRVALRLEEKPFRIPRWMTRPDLFGEGK